MLCSTSFSRFTVSFCKPTEASFLALMAQVCYVNHCDQNCLLLARQSPYRRRHSTETRLPSWLCRLQWHRYAVVPLIVLDLSSAFDTVNHDCLLSVLHHRFSVDGDAMTWSRSYLADRTHTDVRCWWRSTATVNFSVPQGSMLGFIAVSSSRTLKLWRNLLLNTESVTVTICLLTTNSCRPTLPFPATRYRSPVNAWRPASVFCGTGVHLVGCSRTPQRRNWSGSAPGHHCDDG